MENISSTKITKEQCEVLSSFLIKHHFPSTFFTKSDIYRIDHSTDKAIFKKTPVFHWPRLIECNEEKIKEINAEIKEELSKTNKIFEHFEIRTGIKTGDDFVTISDVCKVFGDDEKFSIEHKDGQVLLVQFWATW